VLLLGELPYHTLELRVKVRPLMVMVALPFRGPLDGKMDSMVGTANAPVHTVLYRRIRLLPPSTIHNRLLASS
jgi:hypothetical protein